MRTPIDAMHAKVQVIDPPAPKLRRSDVGDGLHLSLGDDTATRGVALTLTWYSHAEAMAWLLAAAKAVEASALTGEAALDASYLEERLPSTERGDWKTYTD